MATTYLNIPGNIKQAYLPFVLDASNAINTEFINIADETGKATNPKVSDESSAQVFSFKPSSFDSTGGASSEKSGFLRVLPGAFYHENSTGKTTYSKSGKDLSYKLLYTMGNSYDYTENSSSVSGKAFLNNSPSITIREYLQDSKLNQIVNLFQSLFTGMKDAENVDLNNYANNLWEKLKTLVSQFPEILRNTYKAAKINTHINIDDSSDQTEYALKIPYVLYYMLLSSTTTNVYTLPYNGKLMYQSDGKIGWNTDNGINGTSTAGNSMLGTIYNYVFGNIKVNTTPTWTPKDGNQPTTIEFTFDLYNDTLDGAIKNFIFINTIIPHNMFLQYHIYQHAPDLYDVRINGINRLFMCAADFKVEQVGVLRKPHPKFFKRLAEKHKNKKFPLDAESLFNEDYIRVPDIYRVTAKFESLLPNSFNNYIYQYYCNSHIPTTIKGNQLRNVGVLDTFYDELQKQVEAFLNK